MKINISRMGLGIGVLLIATLSAACTAADNSNNDNGPSGDVEEVRTAFSFDMQVPDPDIFFQAEGLNVTMAAYEGLLRHVPNAETPEESHGVEFNFPSDRETIRARAAAAALHLTRRLLSQERDSRV